MHVMVFVAMATLAMKGSPSFHIAIATDTPPPTHNNSSNLL